MNIRRDFAEYAFISFLRFVFVLYALSGTKNAVGIQIYTLKKNSKISGVYPVNEFECENIEYYRTTKIPSTGHFLKEIDKEKNNLPAQLKL